MSTPGSGEQSTEALQPKASEVTTEKLARYAHDIKLAADHLYAERDPLGALYANRLRDIQAYVFDVIAERGDTQIELPPRIVDVDLPPL